MSIHVGVIGGGPAGLYLAIQLALRKAYRVSYDRITERFVHWDDIEVHYRGRVIRSGGARLLRY